MEYAKFKELSGNERNEYGGSLLKYLEEQRKLYEALCSKRDAAVLDTKCKPEIVAQLGEQTKDALRKLQKYEQAIHEYHRMNNQLDKDCGDSDKDPIQDRETIGGSLFCGAGTVSIRAPKVIKPQNAITYGKILEAAKGKINTDQESVKTELVKAVMEQLEKKQNQK